MTNDLDVGDYKSVVQQIVDLNWNRLGEKDLQKVMILSAYAATEFADSLRLALRTHLGNASLEQMAAEELDADNLSFREYDQKGDHSEFLWYFIGKYSLMERCGDLHETGNHYIKRVQSLPPEVRVMSIVSRENELPGIFTRILTAKNWEADGLPEFRYYLERHILLDSQEGGHADMLGGYVVDNRVADFYRIRLEMYKSISTLFQNGGDNT